MVCHEPDFYEDWATRVIDCTKWTTKSQLERRAGGKGQTEGGDGTK